VSDAALVAIAAVMVEMFPSEHTPRPSQGAKADGAGDGDGDGDGAGHGDGDGNSDSDRPIDPALQRRVLEGLYMHQATVPVFARKVQ
jgi:hypothetical protein